MDLLKSTPEADLSLSKLASAKNTSALEPVPEERKSLLKSTLQKDVDVSVVKSESKIALSTIKSEKETDLAGSTAIYLLKDTNLLRETLSKSTSEEIDSPLVKSETTSEEGMSQSQSTVAQERSLSTTPHEAASFSESTSQERVVLPNSTFAETTVRPYSPASINCSSNSNREREYLAMSHTKTSMDNGEWIRFLERALTLKKYERSLNKETSDALNASQPYQNAIIPQNIAASNIEDQLLPRDGQQDISPNKGQSLQRASQPQQTFIAQNIAQGNNQNQRTQLVVQQTVALANKPQGLAALSKDTVLHCSQSQHSARINEPQNIVQSHQDRQLGSSSYLNDSSQGKRSQFVSVRNVTPLVPEQVRYAIVSANDKSRPLKCTIVRQNVAEKNNGSKQPQNDVLQKNIAQQSNEPDETPPNFQKTIPQHVQPQPSNLTVPITPTFRKITSLQFKQLMQQRSREQELTTQPPKRIKEM